ncbi:hypothetical protein AZE42_00260 [Rhizopogon vesiculosus]|uniref:RNA polymerase Rpb1 domain-containing protein n=1 Tax=Rhizopogon vesiculosus TaxID=180088 RepID=A0A1J8PNV0_9AGAM|nr:hypothetical protein AZE42_00260 [Rhizopogon vesiculosus]
MFDHKLTVAYIVGRIAESFKTDLFVMRSDDNSEKIIISCHVLGPPTSMSSKSDISQIKHVHCSSSQQHHSNSRLIETGLLDLLIYSTLRSKFYYRAGQLLQFYVVL